jgi:ABC-2 type transport system ATP-binding protein
MSAEGGGEIRFGAPAGLDTDALAAAVDAAVGEATPGEYVVTAPPTPGNVAAVTAWLAENNLPLADLRAGRQRLEDVFLRLTAPAAGGDDPVESTSNRRQRGRRGRGQTAGRRG